MSESGDLKIPVWIRIQTGNDTRLVFVNDLVCDLRASGTVVQYSEPWHPACSTGIEFYIDIFANIDINEVIVTGLAYDAFKIGFSKIWDLLLDFFQKNKHDDLSPVVKIILDDIEIKFYGLHPNNLWYQSNFLMSLHKHIKIMQALGVEKIMRIQLPCERLDEPDNNGSNYRVSGFEFTKEHPEVWKITYGANDVGYYSPDKQNFV
ncbi:hypothetical protein [Muribaculum intestinale]|uniref:hypothetical protein n=1 Tax=Muribaculum intestinale TaxID=1796646 RepID=UPI00262181C2|nr:hypothetical protein [Muribaculum intestinale]